jgi:hypothetical protein
MKKVLLVVALAVALTFAFTATAFADHSPSFFIKWNAAGGFEGANAAVPSPHNGYVEGTQKCGVCHAVHRAPVATTGWTDDNAAQLVGAQPLGSLPYPADAGGTNRATRQVYRVPAGMDTQMLLQSDVAGACDYCHITTSIGGEQIYAGKVKYRLEATGLAGGSDWEGGFAHNNACTACHAVHGAFINPFAAAGATSSANVVFQGALGPKVVKAYAKNKSTTWQREIYLAGSSYNPALFGATKPVTTSAVDPQNAPLFASKADALAGTNSRLGVDVADAQVTAFCTFCHENYGSASEATINAEFTGATPASLASLIGTNTGLESYKVGAGLFQGPWEYNGYVARNSLTATAGTGGAGLDGHIPIKNHPMKAAVTTGWTAAGKTASAGQVAWKSSDTCRDCHDAGVEEVTGVMIQSWPHFTPGYFKFLKAGSYMGAAMTNVEADLAANQSLASTDTVGLNNIYSVLDSSTVIEEAMTTADGACLKCHVNSTNDAGVGKTF